MKRFFALLVSLTVSISVFTSCGKNKEKDGNASLSEISEEASVLDENSDTDKSNKNDKENNNTSDNKSSESSEKDSDENSNTASKDTSDEASGESSSVPEKSKYPYENAVKESIALMSGNDVNKLMKSMFPNDIVDMMFGLESIPLSELKDEFGPINYELIKITEEEKLDAESVENLEKELSYIKTILDYMIKNKDNPDALYDMEIDEDEVEIIYDVTESYNIILTLKNEDGEQVDQYFTVFYIEGEGWKVDASIRGYVEKSKTSSIRSTANTFHKAANSALIEMDTYGVDLSGTYIISSDASKNYNVKIDINKFKSEMGNFFPEMDNFEYFLFVCNGVCTGVVCYEKDSSKYIGIYPVNHINKIENGKITSGEISLDDNKKYTYDELYKMYIEQIK